MKTTAIIVAALVLAIVQAEAQTAKCTRSCTDLKTSCTKSGGIGCATNFDACKATGTYSMPSGRVWTNICKK